MGLKPVAIDDSGAFVGRARVWLDARFAKVTDLTVSTIAGLSEALAGKATAVQGAKADTALQPADLAPVNAAITAEGDARQTLVDSLPTTYVPRSEVGTAAFTSASSLRDRTTHTGTQDVTTIAGLQAFIEQIAAAAVGAVVTDAPESLDTLGELADGLQGAANAVTALTSLVGQKVSLTGAQTVAGVKTFTDGVVIPDGTLTASKVLGLPEFQADTEADITGLGNALNGGLTSLGGAIGTVSGNLAQEASDRAAADTALAASAMCAVGATAPTPATGKSILWVDTSAGYSVLKIVTGD